MLSRSFNKITDAPIYIELHCHHCPATLISFGEAIVERLEKHFEELLNSTAMLSDKDTVMEYFSSGSIFLTKLQKYLRPRIFLLVILTLPSL